MMGNRILVLIVGLFLALVLALSAGVTSLVLLGRVDKVTDQNKTAIEQIEQLASDLADLKVKADVANCIAANVGRDAVREAIKNSLLALVDPATPLTQEQELRIALYNERVDKGLPYRDCSIEGIEVFLKNPPPDPATIDTLPAVD